jgi:hypothetical protein
MFEDKRQESRVRSRARRHGYRVIKSRRALSIDNAGAFMLVDGATNFVVLGSRFDADLDEIEDFFDTGELRDLLAQKHNEIEAFIAEQLGVPHYIERYRRNPTVEAEAEHAIDAWREGGEQFLKSQPTPLQKLLVQYASIEDQILDIRDKRLVDAGHVEPVEAQA